jgi:cell division topological specificity factor
MQFLKNYFFNKEEKSSAASAKDRLQILIARERSHLNEYDFMPKMQAQILAVIAQYFKQVTTDDIKISMAKTGEMEVLDVNITLPPIVPACQMS